jgi:hypothetical protein
MNRYKMLLLGVAMAVPMAGAVLASAAGNNLIANGTFDSDVAGWDNYGGNPTLYKQTMQITNTYAGNGSSYYSGWYCVKVKPGAEYVTKGDYWVPNSAPENSGASLQLQFYASNVCRGPNLLTGGAGKSGGKVPDQRNEWLTFTLKETAPDGAHSARVRASAIKEPNGGSIPQVHAVYFDNVSFVEQMKIVLPQPTSTPKGPGDIIAIPTPTQTPKGPDDLVADPTPTQTPKGPDDLVSNPQPTQTPGAPETGDSQPTDQPGTGDDAADAPAGGVDVLPQGGATDGKQTAGGDTAKHDSVTPAAVEEGGSVGLQLGLLLLGAGSVFAAIGLGFAGLAKRRRRNED